MLKHTLAYIKGTVYYGITYHTNGTLEPFGFVNSDFAGCKNLRRSTEGNVFIVVGGPISWKSKHQEIVTLSTVKAKYIVFSQATIQAIWLSKFFDKIGLPFKESVVINADNNSAISNSLNNKNYLPSTSILGTTSSRIV